MPRRYIANVWQQQLDCTQNSGTFTSVVAICSPIYESTELSLDICLPFSRVKHVLGRLPHVFWVFSTSGLRCSPLDLRSTTVTLLVLGPSCSSTDSRSTTVKLVLPCVPNVFWIEETRSRLLPL